MPDHAGFHPSLYLILLNLLLQYDTVFLETQVQNITTNPISVDHVVLDPSQYYSVLPLNNNNTNRTQLEIEERVSSEHGDEDDEIFGSSYINPMDMRQYLYKLIPKEAHKMELRSMVYQTMKLSF